MDDPQLVIYCVVDEPNVDEQWHSTFAQNIVREILEEVLPYMNIYRDEEATGLHAGWDIRGEDTGAVAMTDIVNEDGEDDEPQEEGLTDVPDTTDSLDGDASTGSEDGGPPDDMSDADQ